MANGKAGRPKGPTPAKTRLTASVRATQMVERLMGRANDVLEEHLSQMQTVALMDEDGAILYNDDGTPKTKMIGGDPRVAMYVLDRAWPAKGAVLPKSIHADLDTIDGVIECAKKCTEMLLNQQMSLEDARQLMDHLIRYCQLKAYERIDELKLLVEDFEKQNQGKLGGQMDGALLPKWGKLAKPTHSGTKTPAE